MENKSEIKTCNSYFCRLYMAGDINDAKKVIGKYCREKGWCVTVTPTDYIYSGGQESGFIVEAIAYARFESLREQETLTRLHELANILALELNQKSYSVIDNFISEYVTLTMPFEKKRD